jgi:hypothetical protein
MTSALSVVAAILTGLLAGLSLDRTVVAMPAWRHVGVEAWASCSRHADLGRGLVLYPLLGLGAPIMSVATAVAFVAESGPSGGSLPVYGAAIVSFGHALATGRAAPNMARVGRTEDSSELQRAFHQFERWQAVRAGLQVLAFALSLWALVALLGS